MQNAIQILAKLHRNEAQKSIHNYSDPKLNLEVYKKFACRKMINND